MRLIWPLALHLVSTGEWTVILRSAEHTAEEHFCPGGPLPGLWGAPGDTSPGRVSIWVGFMGGATHGFRKHSIREGGR